MHLFFAAAIAAACAALARPDPATIIRGAGIVDVVHGTLTRGQDIVLRGGRIESITPAGSAPIADGDTQIDGTGLFAIPGLFDAHVHITSSLETFPTLLVAHGITAARDLGATTEQAVHARASFAAGEALGPDMFISGAIVDGVPPIWPFSEPVASPDEGRAAVRKLHDAGVDMIKVYTMLKKDVFEAVVSEAHAQGLKVTGHIPESVTLAEAIAARLDCNEHLMRIDAALAALTGREEERNRPVARMMSGWEHFDKVTPAQLDELARSVAASGMAQCPTIIVHAGIGRAALEESFRDPRMDLVPAYIAQFWASPGYRQSGPQFAKVVPMMQKTVAALSRAGVTLMVGTDLSNPFVFAGSAVHEEMALWQDAGIPPADILRAATIVPAEFCGAADRLGSVAQGKTASIVLTRANPLDDIRNAAQIEHVFLRGKQFDRAALDALIAGVRDQVSGARPAPSGEEGRVDLPGTEIARGKFLFKFGQLEAGDEVYVITRATDGYHLHSSTHPKGGAGGPTSLTAHAGPDGRITSAVWRRNLAAAVEATYALSPDHLSAKASRAGQPEPEQSMDLAPTDLFSLPSYAADVLSLRRLALEVGQTRDLTSLTFGYPDWRVEGLPYTITRHPDTTIQRGNAAMPCSHYTAELKTTSGVFKSESWHDPDLVPYRLTVATPFGTLSAERQ